MLIKTEQTDLGYYLVDNRNAEQLPPETTRFLEAPTYTCTHCQRVVVMNPERKRERYKCRGCNHLICDGCAAVREAGGQCKTYAQVIDEYLNTISKET